MKFNVRLFRSKWLVGFAIGVGLACCGADALAQAPSGGVEAIISPRPMLTMENAWFQRQVYVTNSSAQTRQLRIAYRAGSAGGKQTEYSRIFEVPPGARRLVSLPIYPQNLVSLGRPYRPNPEMPNLTVTQVSEDYTLSDPATGQRLALVNELPGNLSGVMEYAVIGSDKSSGQSEFKKMIGSVFGGSVMESYSQPHLMPDRWYGYSAASFVVMVQSDVDAFRPSQMQAILDYVRRGGVMLITGNVKLKEMFSGPLGQAAGVSVAGVHEIMSLELPEGKGKTSTAKFDVPTPMAELVPSDADVVFTTGNLPLLTKKQFGKGWIFTLAVPMPSANETVVREVQAVRNNPPLLNESEFMAPGKAAVSAIAGRAGPRRVIPAGILLGVGALVLVGGVLAKFRGRGERVWLVLVPGAVVLAVGMQIYGLTSKTPQRLSHIGLVSGLDDGRARVQQVFAYGTPDKQTVTFHAASPWGVLVDVGESGGLGGIQDIQTAGPMAIADLSVEPDATKAFYVDEMMQVGRIDSAMTFGPKGLTGTVRNSLGEGLTDAVVYVGGRSFAAGNIEAGSQGAQVTVGRENLLAAGEFTNGLLSDDQKNKLLRQMQVTPGPGKSLGRGALLIATMKSSVVQPMNMSGISTQGWSVVTWPLKVSAPADGSSVLVPPGFVETQIRMGQTWTFMGRAYDGNGPMEIGLRGVLPEEISSLEQAKAYITLHIRASNYVLTLMRIGANGRGAEVIDKVENPTGVVQFTVGNLDKYRDAEGNSYSFALRLQPIQKGEDASQWTLESADIALEGISR